MTTPLFHTLPEPKPDPIFSLLELAKAAGPRAINATAGVYIDEAGKPVIYPSVRKALETLAGKLTTRTYNYPSLLGLAEFREAVSLLLFGAEKIPHAACAGTGGTGALAINMRLLKLIDPAMRLVITMPSWPTHRMLAVGAGLEVIEAPHVKDGKATIDGVLEALERTEGPLAVLLQTGCHNPTGLDRPPEEWNILAEALVKRGAIALLDTAYQGFADEPEKDMEPLRICLRAGVTVIGCWSASKNHSLYSERAGMAYAVTENDAEARKIEGLYSMITRTLHSAAATFGQSVVAEVQRSHADEWRRDIAAVRASLAGKREGLKAALPDDFAASLRSHGMFALLPLTPADVKKLREEHAFFCAGDGRINVAGIPLDRMAELGAAVRAVRG